MKCPSFEQIYDMDLDNLLLLKQHIEKNEINFDIIPLNEDDFDLYDNNSPNDKNTIMNLINSEIKERESTKELLNFFSDLNYNNNIEKNFLAELNSSKNKNDLLSKNILENENKQIQEQNINLVDTNKISSQPIKLLAVEDMKTFLKRTKIDPNKLQYKVSSNKYIEKFWSIDKEKKLRKKNSDISDISSNMTNFSTKINDKNNFKIKNIKRNRSRIFSEKIVIGAINIRKEKTKRKKKKKIKNEDNEGKKINALELRRNYKVADVKKFLKKKTVLKPLNFPNNDKMPNINYFNNELKSPNIKIFNKKSVNIKKENAINEENKNNNIDIKNANIEKNEEEIKYNKIEKIINLLIERFNFCFEKGIFQKIQYGNLNNDKKLNNKDYAIIKKLDEKNKNIFFEILNNISFTLLKNDKKENKQENLIINKNEDIKNNDDSRINYESKEKISKINQINDYNNNNKNDEFEQSNYNKDNEASINERKNDKKEYKILNIKNNKDNINDGKQNIEKKKEIEQQCEEYEEEEEQEEEKEQADIDNDRKNNYIEGVIINNDNKNNVLIQIDKNNFHKNSLNPIKKRKLNINKNKSKQSFISNHILNEKVSNNTNKDEYHNFPKTFLTPDPLSISNNNLSNPNEFKKYVLSSVKPHKIISHYNYIFTKKNQRPKSSLAKNILTSTYTNIISENRELIDYSDIYSNFAELFSGYYLTNNYSEQNHFNINNAMRELYNSFNKLYHYELNHELIQQKDEMYKDIVRAEAGVIINRIKHAQEKLLKEEDININVEKYCLLKKCLELERKNYARENNKEINNIISIPKSKYKKFFRVVLSRPEIYDIVCYTLYKDSTWSELPHGLSMGQCWNLYWSYCPPNIDFTNLFSFQKVNHLINNRIVHRKDLLHKHIMRVRRLNKKNNEMFDIMPLTFLLSKEYVNFVEEFHKYKETDDDNIWIVKPVGKSRGKGIFLINNISDVPLNDTFLVQKYLSKPLLLDEGYKFDMRIYCLITSVNPLEMFLYKDGFARVSNELYNMDITNIKVHLTNAAIQNKNAKKSSNYEKYYGGSKISLDMLRTKLARQYNIDFDYLIWPQVKDIIIKVFACCQNDMPYCPSTFEMFGFDVIIDTNFRCWLLEINSSPSLERTNVLDDEIKLPLVKDIIKIIEPVDVDKLALLNVLERIIKIKNNTKNKEVYLYSPKVQLNMDLNNIFRGKLPRKYGEVPKDLGRFEMICPNKDTDKIIKMAGGQKFYNNKKEKRK